MALKPLPVAQAQTRRLPSRAAAAASGAGAGAADGSSSSSSSSSNSSGGASSKPSKPSRVQEMQQQLQKYGVAGVLAYGILNTLYYTFAFLFVWLCVAKVPAGLGVAGAARRFAEVFALTWGGSQLTKAARAAGALALAPAVDRAITIVQQRAKLQDRRGAFLLIVGGCLSLALCVFAGVVVAYA
jgi:hypothetical protein